MTLFRSFKALLDEMLARPDLAIDDEWNKQMKPFEPEYAAWRKSVGIE